MGYVYLRRDPGNKAFKIGYTDRSSKRRDYYRTASPFAVLVCQYPSFAATVAEEYLRKKLRVHRLRIDGKIVGLDWFFEHHEVVAVFQESRAIYSTEPNFVLQRSEERLLVEQELERVRQANVFRTQVRDGKLVVISGTPASNKEYCHVGIGSPY